jgi:hypothetical protein
VESPSHRVDQFEDRIWGLEDEVDVLEKSDKEKGKKLRSTNGMCKTSGTLLKD